MRSGDNQAAKLARLRTAALGGSPNEDPDHDDLPYWVYLAQVMRKYNWTEHQVRNEVSPAMLARLALLENLEASRESNQASTANPLDRFRGANAQNRIQSI